MPSLSQRQRRRPARDEEDDEAPRSRRRQQSEEEEEEEDEGGEVEMEEEEGEEEEEEEAEEEEDEEDEERQRERRQKQRARRRREEQQRRAANNEMDDDDDNQDGRTEVEDAVTAQNQRQILYYEMLAKRLTRYALASEPRRLPIRRLAVKEQVLDNDGKNFRRVFPIAQEQLQGIFGMTMADWPAREKTTMTMRERRKALKSQKASQPAAKSAAVDRYLLVSTLPAAYQECVFAPVLSDPDTSDNLESAIPPAPDAAYMGFVTLVVALITLNGGEMAQEDLEKLLGIVHGGRPGQARADEEFLQPISAAMGDFIDDEDARAGGGQQEDGSVAAGGTLQHMVRHGYLLRVVEAPTTAEGRGPVGGRAAGGRSKVMWYVGPRGKLEIGPEQVASVVHHVYGENAGPDLERRLRSSLQMANEPSAVGE
ncbi:hypothetical protein SEPCBS119000_004824 [Sporothrix epigloea]|uniref:MAGE domain-containing protein n=1 Tax=Sporothrix epigloea TaxID=1892477 RepID=A0ABP0DY01_9PEZI